MLPQDNQWEQIYLSEGHVLPEAAPRVIQFSEQLRSRGAHTILDLGCGSGRHIVHLAKNGFRVVGLDFAPTGLKLSREWLQKEQLDADLLLADMRQGLPFRDDSFDALISTQVIHHARLVYVLATAKEIQRVVCTGGAIFISVPARREIAIEGDDSIEIEPNTFVPISGNEQGLPHHFFAPDEFRAIFPQFEVLDLGIIGDRIIGLTASKY